jgi:CheY-like chemotaxis protein
VPHTILLVDDEFSFLEVLSLLLTQEGYETLTAADGEEALARLRERRVDLVVTDYWMPGMNGLELCRQMQADEAWRSIPVLMMTAAYDFDIERVSGLRGIVAKPMRFKVLLQSVREILDPPKD